MLSFYKLKNRVKYVFMYAKNFCENSEITKKYFKFSFFDILLQEAIQIRIKKI